MTKLAFTGELDDVAFGPDGHLLACGDDNGTAKNYDVTPLLEKP